MAGRCGTYINGLKTKTFKTMKPKKAAGYIRVSTYGQKENESLPIQRESIKKVAKAQGYEFTKIYADEGISGGTVKDRPGLQLCFEDGQEGAFNVLIVLSLSRFGRNAQELLQNLSLLKESGITLFSINDKKSAIADILFNTFQPFKLGTLASRSSIVKAKGFQPGELITLLMLFPFFNISAVRSFFQSTYAFLSEAQKDTLFRLMNNPDFNWHRFLYLVAKRSLFLAHENGKDSLTVDKSPSGKRRSTCLILDDTMQPKRGKK